GWSGTGVQTCALPIFGAAAHRRDGRRRRQAEIIVPVPVYRDGFSHPRLHFAHEEFDGLRRAHADRIDDGDFIGARVDRRAVDVAQIAEVAARAVHCEEVDALDPLVLGVFHRADHIAHDLLAGEAEGLHLHVAGGDLAEEIARAELEMRVDVGLQAAREAPDFGAQVGGEDALDRLRVFLRDAGEARLDTANAKLGELAGDLEFIVGGKANARRLLAVAQRRVVEANRPAAVEPLLNGVPLLERAGPNLLIPALHGLLLPPLA